MPVDDGDSPQCAGLSGAYGGDLLSDRLSFTHTTKNLSLPEVKPRSKVLKSPGGAGV